MNLLPAEFVKNNLDTYLTKSSTTSRSIYLIVLLTIVIALAALPVIQIDVSVQDTGIIRPIAEKTEIKSSISELVDSVYVKEGQKLNKGDTILTFRRSNPDYQIAYQQKRLDDFLEHLSDLNYLSKGIKPPAFKSNTRQREYQTFIRQKTEYGTNLSKTEKDFKRNQTLFDRKVISEEEYESYLYEYNKAKNALASWQDSQIRQWQNDLNTYSNSYEEMLSAMNQGKKDKDLYVVISPVNGTLDQFNGIYPNSTIQAGNSLALISPDSVLCAEIYVSPRNIGYLYLGMSVNLQISSFNYNEWGSISGKITDISSDFLTDNAGNNSYFKVKCSMDKNFLIRKNGVKGVLKKGMTVSSHFLITKRSLFDLLYQKMDDWANPALNVNQPNN